MNSEEIKNLDISNVDKEFIEKNKKLILEYIENNEEIPDEFLTNIVILDLVRKYKKELLYKFKLDYFFPKLNNDILEKYGDLIISYLESGGNNLWKDTCLLDYLISKKRGYLVFENGFLYRMFPELTNDILEEFGNVIIVYLKYDGYNEWKDIRLLEYLLSKNREDLILKNRFLYNMFPELDNNILEKYGDLIISYLENGGNNLWKDPCLLDYLISKKRGHLVFKNGFLYRMFPELDNDILEEFGDVIILYLEYNGYNEWKDTCLLEYLLSKKREDLILKNEFLYNMFPELDNDILEKYGDLIISYLESGGNNLWEDTCLLDYIISKNREDLIFKDFFIKNMFPELTDDILEKYGDLIILYLEKSENQWEDICLLDYIISKNREDLIFKGNFLKDMFPKLTNDILEKYGDLIILYLEKSWNKWEDTCLLDYIISKNREDLIFKDFFIKDMFPKLTNDILEKYGDLIISCLEQDKYGCILWKDTCLLDYLINKNKKGLIFKCGLLDYMFPKLTNDILEKYGDLIILYLEKGESQWEDTCLLEYLLSKKREDLILKNELLYHMFPKLDNDILEKYGGLIVLYFEKGGYNYWNDTCLLDYLIKKDQLHLLKLFSNINSYFESDEKLQLLADKLEIDKIVLKYKLDYLYRRNDEIYNTLDFEILKCENLDISFISIISVYPLIQEKLLNLDSNLITKYSFIIKKLNTSKYDLSYVFENILNNIGNYKELLNKIELDKLSEEQFQNLVFILQNNDNKFGINDEKDLLNDKFKQKKKEYYEKIKNNIDNIDIEKLKQLIIEKIYGIDYEMAEFIVDRYFFKNSNSLEIMEEYGVDKSTISIIEFLNKIINETDIKSLQIMFLLDDYNNMIPELETDFYSAISLEASIRKQYAKMYSETLYKLSDKDKSNNIKLQNVEYKGKKIQFYEAPLEFNMQIHCLGAYRIWKRPDNFLDDWNRPKISYHGICTSYIGNNQIATAINNHPVLGFSEYEESALLLSGNYDLFSDNAIGEYSSSYYRPYKFLPPREMINSTRHNHNEMVIERKKSDYAVSYKRLPNYIVYFVDDIDDIDNFSESNALYQETLQAAADFSLPIVIVDRLKYAKNEIQKCNQLEKEFYQTRNINKLRDLFLNYMNNAVGCRFFDKKSQYHDIFNSNVVNEFFQRIIEFVRENINKGDMYNIDNIILSLIELTEHEQKSYAVSHASHRIAPELNLDLAISALKKLREDYQNKIINNNHDTVKNM